MATAITKWVASDKSEWTTEEKANERDALIRAVETAMAPLGSIPDGCDFANGSGYFQRTQEAVVQARLALYEIAKGPLGWWIETQKKDHGKTDWSLAIECHPSWHMRMLDGSSRPLEHAYGRIACIDSTFREWGQPYYATHPNKAKPVCLNQ